MPLIVDYTQPFSRTSSASGEAKAFYENGGLGGRKADKATIRNQRYAPNLVSPSSVC